MLIKIDLTRFRQVFEKKPYFVPALNIGHRCRLCTYFPIYLYLCLCYVRQFFGINPYFQGEFSPDDGVGPEVAAPQKANTV